MLEAPSPAEWQALALSLRVSLAATLAALPAGILIAAWLAWTWRSGTAALALY